MKRRDFLTTSSLVLGGAMVAPSLSFANDTKGKNSVKALKHRTFDITFTHNLQEKGKHARLWVPLPLSAEYQSVVSQIKNSGNYDKVFMSDFETPTLYASFSKKNPTITTSFKVVTTERNTDFSKVNFKENEKLSDEVLEYLKPTSHIQIDGIVKEKAIAITKGVKGDLERARALFNWTAETMVRDNSVVGCGVGDAKALLESGKLYGKCTDIGSVFVALCRSVGIPAREVFGIRLGQSRFHPSMGKAKDGVSSITGGQHCRAEFYLKGYGWIPCDPGDVTKYRLAKKLTNKDSQVLKIKEFLFGNWEMAWMAFNTSRDLVLNPKPAEFPLNNFGYPYGEVDENVQNYYDAKSFAYEYKSVEI